MVNDAGRDRRSDSETHGDSIYTKIHDPQGNVIFDKKIETKMRIDYFKIKENGTYTIEIKNLSEHSLETDLGFGFFNTFELIIPGIILIIGILLMMFLGYKKLRDYNIVQPEEKT